MWLFLKNINGAFYSPHSFSASMSFQIVGEVLGSLTRLVVTPDRSSKGIKTGGRR